MSSWCNCESPKTRINAITAGEAKIINNVIIDFHSDYLVRLVSVYCAECGVEVTA
jgi:hypothetical protein